MTVEAKICGLSTPETVDAAVRFGARWVGFVTYPRSPRQSRPRRCGRSARGCRRRSRRVGLFVDPDDALLDEKLATGALDLLQLHGAETPERVAAIRRRTGKPVMKVIKVGAADDVERGIAAYAGVADRLMFDTPKARCQAAMRRPSTGPSCRAARCRCPGSWRAASPRQCRRGGACYRRPGRRCFLWRRIEPRCEIDRADSRLPRA